MMTETSGDGIGCGASFPYGNGRLHRSGAPGGGKLRAASSSTSTQSLPNPSDGHCTVSGCDVSNSPAGSAAPLRGLYHQPRARPKGRAFSSIRRPCAL
jgi:hypothetical protein